MNVDDILACEFGTLESVIAAHARDRPNHAAIIQGADTIDYQSLDAMMHRVAAALQRDGCGKGAVAAICASPTIPYAIAFLGILRAGAVVAPLPPSATAESLARMLADCDAQTLFLDAEAAAPLESVATHIIAKRVALDGSDAGTSFVSWLEPEGARADKAEITPDDPFNIIYSSGTTGEPKGIVQPHAMRWSQIKRVIYEQDAITMISTPLYSNTTLVSFLPTLGAGGTVVLMRKFDAAEFLRLSASHRATHAMLVPVQYSRIMARPDFDSFDLSSFNLKFSTSAPFAPELMADILKRWPGGLVEFYGMTEGGGSCMLAAHDHPHKLHTVGQPMQDHDMRLIDDQGREVGPGEAGEVVGRSPSMMVGYHNQPQKSRDAEWFNSAGDRYIRTGDIGRFDGDGFLVLLDRKKDLIISGGFNIYPSDLEAELTRHTAVAECAVVGVPSDSWGETPVAFVVLRPGVNATPIQIRDSVNRSLGKTQRLTDLRVVDALPRSAIGKVLKRDLQNLYLQPV